MDTVMRRRPKVASPRRSRRPLTVLLAALTLLAGSIAGGVFAPHASVTAAATAMLRTQAATPPMGFNDWNAYGCDVSAHLIEQTADAMVADGMAAAGYRYVDIDDCWMTADRSSNGSLVPDPTRFPDGIPAVAQYVHARGLLLGIYADAGTSTCAGFAGSFGHEQQDAVTFARWGVDLIKYDQCNIPWTSFGAMTHAQVDQQLYTRFANAVAANSRRILLSACTGVDTASDPTTWAPAVSNMWRTTPDITDTFASLVAIVTTNAALASGSGPSRWNDPDMLEIGNGGMTDAENRAEFSLWAIMAAPLIAGTDLVDASAQTLAVYENPAVIAVDQDPLGRAGRLVSERSGAMTLVRTLAGRDVAVVLFNASGSSQFMSVAATDTGLRPGFVTATDLWTGSTLSSSGGVGARVAAHAVVMYRLHAT